MPPEKLVKMRCQICNEILKNFDEQEYHFKLHSDSRSNNPNNFSDQMNFGQFSGQLGDFIPLKMESIPIKEEFIPTNVESIPIKAESIPVMVNSAPSKVQNKTKKKSKQNTLKFKCKYCHEAFPTFKAVQAHKKRNHKPTKRSPIVTRRKTCLIIKGFQSRPKECDVNDYFSKFGKLVCFQVYRHFIDLQYESPESARQLKKYDRFWKGNLLKIAYKNFDEPTTKSVVIEAKKSKPDSIDLKSRVACVTDVNTQFEIVKYVLSTSHRKDSDEKLQTLGTDLQVVTKRFKKDANVYLFGSSTTKLNFPTSDTHIYIDPKMETIVDPLPLLNSLKFFMEETKNFDNVYIMRGLKNPKITCVHIPTKLNCEINISYPLAVCNSKLIRNILDIDDKLRNVMLFLKYFFETNKIVKQGCFKNYALCIMFIFYLQVTYNLPPIHEFNKIEQYKQIHGGWNGGLDPFDPSPYKERFNSLSYHEILKGFFSFYEKFDYESNAICPFVGKTVNKRALLNPDEVPAEFVYYKSKTQEGQINSINIGSVICVQDPFIHNRNITVAIKKSILTQFINLCETSHSKCAKGEHSLLYNILSNEALKKNEERRVVDYTFILKRNKNLKYLDQNRPVGEAWLKVVCEFTKIVLEDFLKMEISEKDDEPHSSASSSKVARLTDQEDVHEIDDIFDDPGRVAISCSAKINLWGGRERNISTKMKKQIAGLNFVESELKITKILMEGLDLNNKKDILMFDLTIECNEKADRAFFRVSDYVPNKGKERVYRRFYTFFVQKMPYWFRKYEDYLSSFMPY